MKSILIVYVLFWGLTKMIDEKQLIELLEDEILRVNTESTPGCGNLYGRDASVMKNTLLD